MHSLCRGKRLTSMPLRLSVLSGGGAEGVERQGVRSNHSSHVANTGVVAAAEDAADQGASNTAVHNQSVPAKPSWQNT